MSQDYCLFWRGKECCSVSETKGRLCYLENYMYNKAKEGKHMSEGFISRAFRGRRQQSDVAGRLPPGQYLESGFPVLSAGPTPHTPLEQWDFPILGNVKDQSVGSGRDCWAF